MADKGGFKEVGYGSPPKHTQFVKGQSGNPKGRPRGSQNLGTILDKVVRQHVKVAENGRNREMSKAETIFSQMVNKALRGDMHATHELRYWIQYVENSAQKVSPAPIAHENNQAVMESLRKRIASSNDELNGEADLNVSGPCQKEED